MTTEDETLEVHKSPTALDHSNCPQLATCWSWFMKNNTAIYYGNYCFVYSIYLYIDTTRKIGNPIIWSDDFYCVLLYVTFCSRGTDKLVHI